MSHLWPALWLSLRVALVETALVTLIGVPLAYMMARRVFHGRSIVEALVILPLVLPPTVVGYLILIALGARSPIGRALRDWFDYSFLFNWHGAVIASAVVALPLVYLPARAAFSNIEPELLDIARLLGASSFGVFWHVSLPLASKGIGSGLMLAFARALGEFGATVMIMGDLPGRQTLPISIWNDYVGGRLGDALPAVIALTAVSLGVILVYNHRSLRA
jgi:molybdate transport system permease protein